MYCSDSSEYSDHHAGGAFQVAIEPLLLKYGVDMTITGHEHWSVAVCSHRCVSLFHARPVAAMSGSTL